MQRKIYLITVLIFSVLTLFANIREVSFYTPVWVDSTPVLDGKLDDKCWQQAPAYTNTYEYFKPNPAAGKLKNTFKIVYNEHGLYLGIINYEKNPEKIRINAKNRDNGNTWLDDCAELFIDSDGQGVGYRKFAVNAGGYFMDILRIDGAVVRDDWNSIGTVFKTKINKDNWVIECFFPWEDLGKKAKEGDVWMFCHIRYAWTSGSFVGTTSSPGGNYSASGNFGYLCFAGKNPVKPEAITSIFMQRIAPPWCVKINDTLVANHGKGLETAPLKKIIADEKAKVEKLVKIENIPAQYQKEYDKLVAEFKNTAAAKEPSVQTYRTLNALAGKFKTFNWKVKLENQFN